MSSVLWYLLPILSGGLLALSCPPHNATPTVWVALVPLLLFLHSSTTPRRAFRGGWLAGTVYFLVTIRPFMSLIWWGWAETPQEYQASLRQQHLFLAVWYPLASAWCGAWWGLWAAALVWLARSLRLRVWFAPALWILCCEYLRSLSFFDFTWGFLGYALHPYHSLRELASVTGVTGLSALIVLINAWIAHSLLSLRGLWVGRHASAAVRASLAKPFRELGVTVSVLLASAAAWEAGVLASRADAAVPSADMIRVGVLQGGVRTYSKAELTSGALDQRYGPFLDVILRRRVQLVVMPESVWLARLALDDVPTPKTLSKPVRPADVEAFLAPRLSSSDTAVMVDFELAQAGQLYNSIVAWNRHGMVGRYDKRRLTPFAEYPPWPWQYVAPKGRLVFTPGRYSQLLILQGIRVGSFICQEVQFPSLTRHSVRAGAELLVSTGNDGIFRDHAVALGHHVMAQFRAIETHRPLVRAMKTGISSIMDAHGHLLERSALDQQVVLLGAIAPSKMLTPYARWGDWLVLVAAGAALMAWLLRVGAVSPRRAGRSTHRRGLGR